MVEILTILLQQLYYCLLQVSGSAEMVEVQSLLVRLISIHRRRWWCRVEVKYHLFRFSCYGLILLTAVSFGLLFVFVVLEVPVALVAPVAPMASFLPRQLSLTLLF